MSGTTGERILITGATGFLGRELVDRILREGTEPMTLLVRGKDDVDAKRRGDKLLDELAASPEQRARVRVERADLEKERLGLDRAAYERVTSETGSILHGAASVSFTLPLEEARAVNVEGTRRVLDLAKAAKARVDYVGTAYVAGERHGRIGEDDLDVGQSFRNTYEQTKMEAERLVRSRWGEQPIAVHRPSIIVGDSTTGRTSSFKVLYWPLKIYARGVWRVVPGRASTRVDIVPSDYVARAVLHLRTRDDALAKSHHLAAGDKAARLGDLVELAARFFHAKRILFVDPEKFVRYARPIIDRFTWGKLRRTLMTGRVYTPYLSLDLTFDTARARAALDPAGIVVPRVETYFEALFRYCIESDWGKRP